jgi:hypothetical protein
MKFHTEYLTVKTEGVKTRAFDSSSVRRFGCSGTASDPTDLASEGDPRTREPNPEDRAKR